MLRRASEPSASLYSTCDTARNSVFYFQSIDRFIISQFVVFENFESHMVYFLKPKISMIIEKVKANQNAPETV